MQGELPPTGDVYRSVLLLTGLQYIHAVVFGAPFIPTKPFLKHLPCGLPAAVYHGPTSFMQASVDPYTAAKEMGIYKGIPTHDFQHVNAGEIVERILRGRAKYEERQRAKGVKGVAEEEVRRAEAMARDASRTRKFSEVERMFGA